MSFLHSFQSIFSDDRKKVSFANPAPNSFNDILALIKSANEEENKNEDHSSKLNSILMKRNSSDFFGNERIEAVSSNRFNKWMEGFQESGEFNIEAQKKKELDSEEAKKEEPINAKFKETLDDNVASQVIIPFKKFESKSKSRIKMLDDLFESHEFDNFEGGSNPKISEKCENKPFDTIRTLKFSTEKKPAKTDKSTDKKGIKKENPVQAIQNQIQTASNVKVNPKECCQLEGILDLTKSEKPRKYKTEFVKSLVSFFSMFFNETEIDPELYSLSEDQEIILKAVVDRKFEMQMPIEFFCKEKMWKINFFKNILKINPKKRPEECYKHFLVRIIKFLKEKLTAKLNRTRAISDEEFYNFYFGEVSSKESIPIKDFHYPFSKTASNNAKLNSRYFELIVLSEKFVQDSILYFDKVIYEDHKVMVSKKLFSLLKPYDQLIRKRQKTEKEMTEELSKYCSENKHCKFPWTVTELKESAGRFKSSILKRF